MSAKSQKQPTALQSILAGGAAGGVESLVTYPTEYIKTKQQLAGAHTGPRSPLRILAETLKQNGIRSVYTGAGIFCLSNTSKSAVRFTTFDFAKRYLPVDGKTGKPTALSTIFAGMCAGIAESVTVLTPGENIKTKLIDGQSSAFGAGRPSSGQVVISIVRSHGVVGLFRGVVPVSMKQSANAMVRFTSYSILLDKVRQLLAKSNKSSTAVAPAVAGGMAGIVTVYATMPFDNIKTKLQAIQGNAAYSGTWDCLRSIVHTEGVKGLWKGTTPRLVRLSVSGMISFSIYEQVIALTNPQEPAAQLKSASLEPL